MENNIKSAGSSTVASGEYGNIQAAGSCRINGDIVCENLKTAGSCHAYGNVVCREQVSTSGACHINGDLVSAKSVRTAGSFHLGGRLDVETLKTAGSCHIERDARAVSFETSGSCTVGGKLHAENIRCSGRLTVEGDCEGETIALNSARITGLLNGGTVEFRLPRGGFASEAASIGCEKLIVDIEGDLGSAVRRGFFFRNKMTPGTLKTDSIEADEVFLCNTKAKKVSCVNAEIVDGCEIDLLEYSGVARIADSAVVKEIRKL